MKLPIIASAIVALAIAVPSLASQAEGAGTPAEEMAAATTEPTNAGTANQPAEPEAAEEGKEERHKKKGKKRKGHKHRKHHHHAGHHKDCDGKHATGEPCNPGQFCPDK